MKESSQPLCLNQQVEDVVQQAHKLRSEAMRNGVVFLVNAVKRAIKVLFNSPAQVIRKPQKAETLPLFTH